MQTKLLMQQPNMPHAYYYLKKNNLLNVHDGKENG